MRISVITCTRNRPEHIERAITAVLESTHPDFDMIVVDQSSDGQTRAIVEPAAARDRRLHYVHRPEPGKSKALNFGIGQSRSPIVALTDDDCAPRPDWLSVVARLFHEAPIDVICGKVSPAPCDPEKGYILGFDPGETRILSGRWARVSDFGIGANMAMRRTALERVGYFDEMVGPGGVIPSGDDSDFLYRAIRKGCRVLLTPEPEVVHYGFRSWGEDGRQHGRRIHTAHAIPYTKFMRHRDPTAFYGYMADFLGQAREAGGRLVRGRRPFGVNRVRAMVHGLVLGMKYPLDPATMLFRPRP